MGGIYRLIEFNAGHQGIKNKRENHPILNQIYDLLTEFHNQGKQLTLCKVPTHIGIIGNEEGDKAAKQATDMPGMTTTRLPHTDYYLIIRRAGNSKWQMEWENSASKLYYIQLRIKKQESAHNSCRQYEVKLSRIHIGHTRLTHGIINNQHAEMQHVETRD